MSTCGWSRSLIGGARRTLDGDDDAFEKWSDGLKEPSGSTG
ncbi:hypothetical protein [Amycolatopsis thermoflava]